MPLVCMVYFIYRLYVLFVDRRTGSNGYVLTLVKTLVWIYLEEKKPPVT